MKPGKEIFAYIKSQPKPVQIVLLEMYDIIKAEALDSCESVRYGMPKLLIGNHPLYFGAFKKHLGLYPGPEVIASFQKELKDWKNSKGAIQFPYSKPLPKKLVQKIVRFCSKL